MQYAKYESVANKDKPLIKLIILQLRVTMKLIQYAALITMLSSCGQKQEISQTSDTKIFKKLSPVNDKVYFPVKILEGKFFTKLVFIVPQRHCTKKESFQLIQATMDKDLPVKEKYFLARFKEDQCEGKALPTYYTIHKPIEVPWPTINIK